MPYIKRIEINGFKTFGIKTTLTFDRGFTVITGPNGSGKTNIIDAILFCLGELSAKRLRAENFSNLIFNGGEKSGIRKSEAKVVIQFDNSDGRIPVETSTVTIAREIDQKGESIYRINGRRVPRNHLLEVLSVAGISPYGHNIVLQGTLTRMAEISTQERRKIIEDMLGIAQYDAEKAEAEAKLKEAEVAIKAALGQISEVQRRLEDLERERNNLMRYNILRREMARLESIKISNELKSLELEANRAAQEAADLEERNRHLAERRENLRLRRRELENELRRLGFDEAEAKRNRILEIQMGISNLRSRLNELTAGIEGGKADIERLMRLRENLQKQSESVRAEIEEAEGKIRQLSAILEQIGKEISDKQALYNSISGEINKVRAIFEERARRANEIEEQLNQLHREKISIESEYARINSRIGVYLQRIEDVKAKKEDLKASCEKLRESLLKLEEILNGQREQMKNLQATLERQRRRRALLEKEIKEAERIAESAKEVLIEFGAQKDLISKIKSEEIALRSLEELGALGVINGIHGRLKNLVKVKRGYERAIEAAASGWLDALVVEDLNVAFTCIETLKRMKLGRVKIIPLKGLSPNNSSAANTLKATSIEGLGDRVSSFIECESQYMPAVNFVLGDTLIALNDDAALRASKEGIRVVTLSGDLYEAGGGVESGFYRAQIDLSSFIPSDEALKNLERAVKTLKGYLDNRGSIIAEIEGEIFKVQDDIARLSESIGKLESEVERVKRSISQAEQNMEHAERTIAEISSWIERDRNQLASFNAKLREIEEAEKALSAELERLRNEISLLKIHDADSQREAIAQDIMALRRKYGSVESEILTLKSKVENVLRRSLESLAAQMEDVSSRILSIEKDITESIKERDEVLRRIGELEGVRDEISRELMGARERVEKYTSEIDALDAELAKLDREYESGMRLLNELRLKIQSINLQMSRHMERLKTLGYEHPIETRGDSAAILNIDLQLKIMRDEIERIGLVNQLAESQYEEQASRYKELSIRLNELEKEKMAILKFIDEIERKKREVFMEAFNKINERINGYFSRLTGGGSASLKLENPENPFAGGVDMIVQFPGKPPILVSGASSGERSVSAVAFLFALQEFSPASFYLFDEIDAHLDAFHVERLGELLAEEVSKSQLQFIVITLKPEMISKADRIYGVYGQNGISHVISTTFRGIA
ncbi:MAG: chromosome segregation protein SMC [Candidatus Bathyarchaeia archaeon]|nr:chromosome segregation protein SMC [Candidatus Bathyarchaeota archaeon]